MKKILGGDCITRNVIVEIDTNEDDNFNNLLNAISNTLNSAIITFSKYFRLSGIDEFIQLVKYDYSSLQVTIVYNLLELLSITYAENLPNYSAVKNMTVNDTCCSSDEDMNRKRVERLKKAFDKRNTSHSTYLNLPQFVPKILAGDSLWYELLSDFPILKRFLLKEEATVSKKFFDELNLVYKKINKYNGYDRFYLMYKLEVNSKLEMFYKILSSIKKEKRRLKLVLTEVENIIDGMYYLHIVPYNHPELPIIVNNSDDADLFNEILSFSYSENTINKIVFNVDKLIDYYTEAPTSTINFVRILNIIHNVVVFHLCNKIENELSLSSSKIGFEFIKGIQHCKTATAYFDDYINSKNLVNIHKDCSKDITFAHFKRIYKVKTEPSRKQN